jgi:hypothetical protein
MRIWTIVLATLMTSGLCGCARQVRTVDIDAPGYADGHLTGFELLVAASDHAQAVIVSCLQLRITIHGAELDDKTAQRLYNRADILHQQAFDCLELSSIYKDPQYSPDAEQRQIYRAIVDRLKDIHKKRIELSHELSLITSARQEQSQE